MPNSKKTTEMVSEAACYFTEQRGFKSGCQQHDWLEAEAKIDCSK